MWLSAASHLQPPGKAPAAPVFILALNAGKGSNVSSSLQVSTLDFLLDSNEQADKRQLWM